MRLFLRRLWGRLRALFHEPPQIREVWFSTDRPSEALFTAMQRRLRERLGIKEW